MTIGCVDKLAAFICLHFGIPHEHQKLMTARQICSLVEYDHYPIRRAEGGPDVHWNIMPRLRAEHRIKTKRDLGEIAKNKRIKRKFEEHNERMRRKYE